MSGDLERKLIYLGKMKKKIIENFNKVGILLPENATWKQMANASIFFRQRRSFLSDNNLGVVDGMSLPIEEKNFQSNVKNSYNPEYKYPININKLTDLSVIDIDSENFDFNIALCVMFFLYRDYTRALLESDRSDFFNVMNKISVERLRANFLRETRTFTYQNYWDTSECTLSDPSEKIPGTSNISSFEMLAGNEQRELSYKIASYDNTKKGPMIKTNDTTGVFSINIGRRIRKSFTYSCYIKADREMTATFKITDVPDQSLRGKTLYPKTKSIKVSTKWKRVFIHITINGPKETDPENLVAPISPHIVCEEGVLSVALPMLTPGHRNIPYSDPQYSLNDNDFYRWIMSILNRNKKKEFFTFLDKINPYMIEDDKLLSDVKIWEKIDKFKTNKASEIYNWCNNLSKDVLDSIKSNTVLVATRKGLSKDLVYYREFKPKKDRYIPNPYMGYIKDSRDIVNDDEEDEEVTTTMLRMTVKDTMDDKSSTTQPTWENSYKWETEVSYYRHPYIENRDRILKPSFNEISEKRDLFPDNFYRNNELLGQYYLNGNGFCPDYSKLLMLFTSFFVNMKRYRRNGGGITYLPLQGEKDGWFNGYNEAFRNNNTHGADQHNYDLYSVSSDIMRSYYEKMSKDNTEKNTTISYIDENRNWQNRISDSYTQRNRARKITAESSYNNNNEDGIYMGLLEKGERYEPSIYDKLSTKNKYELNNFFDRIKRGNFRFLSGDDIPKKSEREEMYWKFLECIGYRIHMKDVSIRSYLDRGVTGGKKGQHYLVTITLENKGHCIFYGLFRKKSSEFFIHNRIYIARPNIDETLYDSISGTPNIDYGYITIKPRETVKITIELPSVYRESTVGCRTFFQINELYSNKPITFDNEEFDKFPVIAVADENLDNLV